MKYKGRRNAFYLSSQNIVLILSFTFKSTHFVHKGLSERGGFETSVGRRSETSETLLLPILSTPMFNQNPSLPSDWSSRDEESFAATIICTKFKLLTQSESSNPLTVCKYTCIMFLTYLIFVTDTTDGVCGEKIGHVEKFSPWHVVKWKISPHDRCGETLSHGEISPHEKCGENLSHEEIVPHEKCGGKSVKWKNSPHDKCWEKSATLSPRQGQQSRRFNNQEAQGGATQSTFLLLNWSLSALRNK